MSANIKVLKIKSWLSVICITISSTLRCEGPMSMSMSSVCSIPWPDHLLLQRLSVSWASLWAQTALLNRKLLIFIYMTVLSALNIHLSPDCSCSTKPPNSEQTETHLKKKQGCLKTTTANEMKVAWGNKMMSWEDRNQQIHQHHPSTQQLL